MADFEHARAMLRMAYKDFNALSGMLDNALFADEIFGFHVQQAVEKALKSWLCAYDVAYPPTHDLARLLTLLEKSGADLEQFWPLVQFTIFAVQARYEEGLPSPHHTHEPLNHLRTSSLPCTRSVRGRVGEGVAQMLVPHKPPSQPSG